MRVTELKRCHAVKQVCLSLVIARFELTKRSGMKVLLVKIDKTYAINSLKRGKQRNRPGTVSYILL